MTKGKNEAANSGSEKAPTKEGADDKTDIPPAAASPTAGKARSRVQPDKTGSAPAAPRRSGAGAWVLFLLVLFIALGFAAWSLIQPDITRQLAGTFGAGTADETYMSDGAVSPPAPREAPSPSSISSAKPETQKETQEPAPIAASAPVGLDAAEIARIESRLSRIESRLAKIDSLVQSAGGDRSAEIASLDAMEQRIATLETANRNLSSNDEGMAALILSVGQLQAAASSSAPFNRELAALKAVRSRFFSADFTLSSTLESLSTPAAQGVLTIDELRDSFPALASAALEAERIAGPDGAENSSLLDRGWARLKGLVTIRRVGADVAGDTTEAHLARAEALLQKGDLSNALSETQAIEGPAAGPLAAWQVDAEARLSTDQAMETISAAALAQVTGAGPGAESGP